MKTARIVLAAGMVVSLAASALAQDTKHQPSKHTTPTTTTPAKQPPATTKAPATHPDPSKMTQEELMQAWEQANPVTPEHTKLAMDLVGEWNAETTCWTGPSAAPTKSTGKAKFLAVPGMQTRFVSLEYTGDFMGKAFKGQGYIGFNTASNKYESIWFDNMTNGFFFEQGTKNATGTIEWSGTCTDPFTKQPKPTRSTWTWKDPNTLTCAMFDKDENGKEYKHFEITYSRIGPKKELPAGTQPGGAK